MPSCFAATLKWHRSMTSSEAWLDAHVRDMGVVRYPKSGMTRRAPREATKFQPLDATTCLDRRVRSN